MGFWLSSGRPAELVARSTDARPRLAVVVSLGTESQAAAAAEYTSPIRLRFRLRHLYIHGEYTGGLLIISIRLICAVVSFFS
jgi:hypothetical protein